jgi:hypothetical protein
MSLVKEIYLEILFEFLKYCIVQTTVEPDFLLEYSKVVQCHELLFVPLFIHHPPLIITYCTLLNIAILLSFLGVGSQLGMLHLCLL